MSRQDPSAEEVLRTLGKLLLQVPPWWIGVGLVALLASLVDLSWTAESGWAVGVQADVLTLGVLGIFWLPVMLKAVALAGGRVKVAGHEAEVGQIAALITALSRLEGPEQYTAKSNLLTVTELAGDGTPELRPALQPFREDLERSLAALRGGTDPERLADFYARVRNLENRGERLFESQRLVGEMRVAARRDPPSDEEIREWFGAREPERMLALAAIQVLRDPKWLQLLLSAIREPASGFEQYEALRAADLMAGRLAPSQRSELSAVLNEELNTGSFGPESDRGRLTRRLLSDLGART